MNFEIVIDNKVAGKYIDDRIEPAPGFEELTAEWNGEKIGFSGCGNFEGFIAGFRGIMSSDYDPKTKESLLEGLCFSSKIPYAECFRFIPQKRNALWRKK